MKESTSGLRPLIDWPDEVTIVPFSGIQILDFGFDSTVLPFRKREFVEVRTPVAGHDDLVDLVMFDDDEHRTEALSKRIAGKDQDPYEINIQKAFEPFLGEWIPVPVLRVKEQTGLADQFRTDNYPSCWARMRVIELDEVDPQTGHDHRVQLALDTALAEDIPGEPNVAPTWEDAAQREVFAFNPDPDQIAWFLQCSIDLSEGDEDEEEDNIDLQKWASDWLEELFLNFRRRRYPKRSTAPEDLEHVLEHWARYLTCLAMVNAAVKPPAMRLTNVVGADDSETPVKVDLVLDVGNNRTCGVLTETFPIGDDNLLEGSFPMHLRDLCHPEILHEGLFASRVEFKESRFGPRAHTTASPNQDAFLWPSIVRIGPEALSLAAGQRGTETASGLSSPKRYLWDLTPVEHDWRFHDSEDRADAPYTVKRLMVELNSAGDVIKQLRSEVEAGLRSRKSISGALQDLAINPRFSRSSLYTFMLMELIAQVMVQINDPGSRHSLRHSNLPRMLERIILTLPTAMPMQEQAIVRSRAEGALRLVWSMMGLEQANAMPMPELVVRWDEASCTQMVWLYSEIAGRFEGRIQDYLTLRGKPRAKAQGEQAKPSLRVACIDIGGGTTDLMVMTYWERNEVVLVPQQTFREGFRIAGDDLVERIGTDLVIPAIADRLREAGVPDSGPLMRELFGPDGVGADQNRTHQRRTFGLNVIATLATAILERIEQNVTETAISIDVGAVLNVAERQVIDETAAPDADPVMERVSPAIHAYLDETACARGADRDWRLVNQVLDFKMSDIDRVVRDVFARPLSLVGEAAAHLDADIVLLSGRPSRLPAIRDIVEAQMVVTPDRLVTLHNYRTGGWYPYRDPATDQIGDPKSTVAMGGLLMTRAGARIRNFRLETDRLRMKSTAHYIGFMDQGGKIRDGNVLFRDLDPEAPPQDGEEAPPFELDSPRQIGARQLPLERWITQPLYEISFTDTPVAGTLPYKVTLARADALDIDPEDHAYDHARQLRAQALREAFGPIEVETNGDGRDDINLVSFRLQTIGETRDYWLDTGVFKLR